MKNTRLVALPMAIAALLVAPAAAGAVTGPDLAVSVKDAPDPVAPGANITYTITLKNIGGATAQHVELDDSTPKGTTFVSFTAPAGWTSSSPPAGGTGTAIAHKSSLAAGAQGQFTFTVKVDPSAAAGTAITNKAAAFASVPDAVQRNDVYTSTTTVERAELIVSLSGSPDPVAPDHDLTYTSNLSNLGGLAAQNVSAVTQIPANTTFVSASAPAGWSISAPSPGGSGQVGFTIPYLPAHTGLQWLSVTVHVNPGVPEGTLLSDAIAASSASPDSNLSDNSASKDTLVTTKADLQAVIDNPPAMVAPGSDVSYSVSAVNHAPGIAHNVSLAATVPVGTTFVSAVQTHGPAMTCTPGTTSVTCAGASLAQDEFATFDLTLHVSPGAAGSKLAETVTTSTSSAELSTANNSASAATTVTGTPPGVADLVLRLKHSGKGRRKTLTLRVRNAGSAVAAGTRLKVTLATKLRVVKKPTGCSLKKRVLKCSLGGIAAGASTSRKLALRAQRSGKFKVKARVTSASGDAHPANNARAVTLSAH